MGDLWERLDRFREEAVLYRAHVPDKRWDRLLDDLAALATEARQRERNWAALLHEVTLVLSCTRSAHVLELIMDAVIRLSGAQRGFLLLQLERGAQEIVAARSMERTSVETPEGEISRRVVAAVLETGKTVRLDDALSTPPYSLAESVTRLKIVSVLCVPIRMDGNVLGLIYLENRKLSGVFSEETEQLIAQFSERIGAAILNAEALEELRRSRDRLRAAFGRECCFEGVVGHSSAFTEMLRTVSVAARSDIPILIEGESGTGKELIARAVHLRSPRCCGEFVTVNCAALPHALLESELFGHRRGAFTGAVQDRRGLFATARGGTLFLDEIGDMPVELQAKLLRVLQSGEYRPVGSDRVEMADVRIVAATVRNLAADVKAGRFRQDLFFRLKGVRVVVPPLRARREDIPLLIEQFLKKFMPTESKLTLDADARSCLLAYDYPGNVRELETIIRRAALFERDGVIGLGALPPEIAGATGRILHLPARIPTTGGELLAAKKQARAAAAAEIERAFLLQALAAADGRAGEAARKVGMNRSQFARMLSRHGLSGKALVRNSE